MSYCGRPLFLHLACVIYTALVSPNICYFGQWRHIQETWQYMQKYSLTSKSPAFKFYFSLKKTQIFLPTWGQRKQTVNTTLIHHHLFKFIWRICWQTVANLHTRQERNKLTFSWRRVSVHLMNTSPFAFLFALFLVSTSSWRRYLAL